MKFLGVNLEENVGKSHFLAYLIAVLISSGYAGAMAMLQPGLLQVIDIPFADQGSLTGMLGALQEVIFILILGLYGLLSDKIGRRPVYVFGLLVTSLGFALYGQAQSITELVIYRVIVAIGSAAMLGMMVTIVADYAKNESRGKANGLQAFVATLGAFIPPLLILLPKVFVDSGYSDLQAQQATFGVAGAMGVVGAIVAFYGLSKTVGKVVENTAVPFMKMLKEGLSAAKEPATALSYGAAFISRGDLAVTGAFMGLWLVQFGTKNLGMSPSEAMSSLAASRIFIVVFGAMIGAFIMGYIADRVSRVTAVSLSAGLAAVVYTSMFFVEDPSASWVLPLLFVMGIAEISAFVSSQALVGQQAPAKTRGVVFGFFGVAGAVGILVAMVGGGALFSQISPAAPFVLFGILNAAVCIWSLLIRPKVKPVNKEQLVTEGI